jgi:hypothetical protein
MFAGTENSGVFYSSNSGNNWTQTSLNNRDVYIIEILDSYIFAGCFYNDLGVYISSNNGLNWSLTPLNDNVVWSFAVYDHYLFAGTDMNGIYMTFDYGSTWIQKNQGLIYGEIYSLLVSNNYIFAGPGRYSLWKRPISNIIGIQKISNLIPDNFLISQNYPNPFNSTTKFKLQISKFSDVKIVIYDILGKEIATLLKQRLDPGIYEIIWDAVAYSSGIYYCQLISEDYSETKKVILLK